MALRRLFLATGSLLLRIHAGAQAATNIARACASGKDDYAFCDTSLTTDARVNDIVKRLSMPEKTQMLIARASPNGAVASIGLPEYNWGANCVHGVQSTCGTNCATSFPNPVNFGAIFDPQIVFDMAQVIGWELRALWLEGKTENYKSGPHLGLDCWSPNININRDPRWGRNMETPSEDPLVNSLYGVAYTRGLQEGKQDPRYLQAVVTLKHFMAYSLEHYGGVDRMEFDAIVSKYDLADTYFPAFRRSIVEGKAKGVMCSYNSMNGVPMCANNNMTAILRDDLGFDGYITGDTAAIEAIYNSHHYTKDMCDAAKVAIMSGTNIDSGSAYRDCLTNLVAKGELDEAYVDYALRKTLRLRFELGLFDPVADQPYWNVSATEVNKPTSQALSREATRKSLVLLQNKNQTLPLAKGTNVAVIGPHSQSREGIMGNYYGQICHGDYKELGCVQTMYEAMVEKNGAKHTTTANGSDINGTSTDGFDAAIQLTQDADAVVLFLGIDTTIEREAHDRDNIDFPAIQLQLLKEIYALGKPTTVVLFNGGIVGAENIIQYTDSLIEAFYPGFYGAQAVTDVLFGDYNPGGKLPVTMYRSDYVDSVNMKSMSMTEYPGRTYRYFKEEPVFPFGWGLSYTSFALSAPNGNASAVRTLSSSTNATTFNIRVKNNGSREGDEVVFGFFRPVSVNGTGSTAALLNQQLLDYQRVSLAEGESVDISFQVNVSTLGLYDDGGNFVSYPGTYEVLFTNGVDQSLAFRVNVSTPQQILRTFPSPQAPSFSTSSSSSDFIPTHKSGAPASAGADVLASWLLVALAAMTVW